MLKVGHQQDLVVPKPPNICSWGQLTGSWSFLHLKGRIQHIGKYSFIYFLTQTIIIISANIPHKAMCLLWLGLHTSLQSLNLSQVYLSNLQWADMETSAKPSKHKIPFSCHLFIVQWNNRFLWLFGKRILREVPGWIIHSDMKHYISINWRAKLGMRPRMFTIYELEMLLGFYQWDLPTFTSCFLLTNTLMTSTDPSFHKNMDWVTDYFRSKVSDSPACRVLKLFLFQGRQPTQISWTTKATF